MARILIAEPSPEVRELIRHYVARLGHTPVLAGTPAEADGADAMIVEPADGGLEHARRARAANPALPIVCLSIFPASSETRALAPAAHLLKPFAREELERALAKAVAA